MQGIPFDDLFIDVLQHVVRIAFHQSVLDQVFDAPADAAQSVDEVDRDVFVDHIEHLIQQFLRVFAEVGFTGMFGILSEEYHAAHFSVEQSRIGGEMVVENQMTGQSVE